MGMSACICMLEYDCVRLIRWFGVPSLHHFNSMLSMAHANHIPTHTHITPSLHVNSVFARAFIIVCGTKHSRMASVAIHMNILVMYFVLMYTAAIVRSVTCIEAVAYMPNAHTHTLIFKALRFVEQKLKV